MWQESVVASGDLANVPLGVSSVLSSEISRLLARERVGPFVPPVNAPGSLISTLISRTHRKMYLGKRVETEHNKSRPRERVECVNFLTVPALSLSYFIF